MSDNLINQKRAESLFMKLHGRFNNIEIADEDTNKVADPKQARFFVFIYSSGGKGFGKVTISMLTGKNLSIYYAKNITQKMNESERKKWYEFLRELRIFAKSNMLSFDVRDISTVGFVYHKTSSITEDKDPKLSKHNKTITIKFSPNVKILKKCDKNGNVFAVFIETKEGERFKCPFIHRYGVYTLANHIDDGGAINDEFGKHLQDLVKKYLSLLKFRRITKNKPLEAFESAEETTKIMKIAEEEFFEAKKSLRRMSTKRGYQKYKTLWVGHGLAGAGLSVGDGGGVSENVDSTTSIKTAFTEKHFDKRLESALPYIENAIKRRIPMKESKKVRKTRKKGLVEHYIGGFEDYINTLTEETWKLPETGEDIEKLRDILTSELKAGPDGINANAAIYDFIGDDDLTQYIRDIGAADENADASKPIRMWLKDNMPDLFVKVFPDGDPDEKEEKEKEDKSKKPVDEDISTILQLAGKKI